MRENFFQFRKLRVNNYFRPLILSFFTYVFKDARAEQWQSFQLTAVLVCYCNIYNPFCYYMKHHSMTNIHVLTPLEMHRETFIFFWTLFMNKTEIIPLLTEHNFKTLHQNSMLSTYRQLGHQSSLIWCNFGIN